MPSIALIVRSDAAIESLPDDWIPEPLGPRDTIRDLIASVAAVPPVPQRFDLESIGLSLELDLGDEDPTHCVTASGRFGEGESALLAALCEGLSARLYDSDAGAFIV